MNDTKNKFLFNTIILVICSLLCKVISAFYRIPLLKVLGSDGLGLYQMIFPIYALLLVLSSSGIIVAMSKFVALEIKNNNFGNIRTYTKASLFISITIAIILTIILSVVAPFLASHQGDLGLVKGYLVVLPAIIMSSAISVFRGYFLGRNEMMLSGSVQIVEQISKLIFSLYFANFFSNGNISWTVFGALLGNTISELIGLCFSVVIYFFARNKKSYRIGYVLKRKELLKVYRNGEQKIFKTNNRYISFADAIKRVLRLGFFVTLNSCIFPLLGAIDSLIIVPMLIKNGIGYTIAYAIYGIEDGIISSLIAMPSIISLSVGMAIIPNIKSKPDNGRTISNVKKGIELVWLVAIASSLIFMFFSKEIISFLYSGGLTNISIDEMRISIDLLKINSFSIIYISLLNITTSVLQGLEKSKIPLRNMLISVIFRTIIILMLVPVKEINIYGTAIADMIFYSVAFILNLIEIRKELKVSFSVLKLVVSPFVSCMAMFLFMEFLKKMIGGGIPQKISTCLIIGGGLVVYSVFLIITKGVEMADIKQIFVRRKKPS